MSDHGEGQEADGHPSRRPRLAAAGVALAAAAIVLSAAPIRRVESIVEVRALPTPQGMASVFTAPSTSTRTTTRTGTRTRTGPRTRTRSSSRTRTRSSTRTPTPTPSSTGSATARPRLELQRRVATSKTLPDALAAALFTGGVALIIFGFLTPESLQEVGVGPLKFTLARAVARANVEKAREAGELSADAEPVVERVAERSAVDAIRASELYDARSRRRLRPSATSGGYIPGQLLKRLVEDAERGKLDEGE
jgi:hypothetical protein